MSLSDRLLVDAPGQVRDILATIAERVIDFTRQKSALIGDALAQAGHGFASSRVGTGIGLSCDNVLMISPDMYGTLCLPAAGMVASCFGGLAFHCCGDWTLWAAVVTNTPDLVMVDGAFTPATDPQPNPCEVFRDLFADSGVVVQARMVGDPEMVLPHARRLWKPGMRLIVTTSVEDVPAQLRLYQDLHDLCR